MTVGSDRNISESTSDWLVQAEVFAKDWGLRIEFFIFELIFFLKCVFVFMVVEM